jgi:hypothetical protein
VIIEDPLLFFDVFVHTCRCNHSRSRDSTTAR